ncbi:MAG: metal ABC transporter ATP-binding protein [Bauldia sp.]
MTRAAPIHSPSAAPIRFANATLGYAGRPIVRDLDWTVGAGSMTAIVGPNGAGKSTLLRAMAGELAPLSGRIERGVDRRRIAYLPQSTALDRTFPIAVGDLVGMGLFGKVGAFGGIGRHWSAEIDAALAAVGLADFRGTHIGALSGGELQRVLFARLILQDPSVVLLDEPFASIDQETTEALMAILQRWHGDGRTVIAALHDLDQVRRIFPDTLRLAASRATFGPTPQMLSVAASVVLPAETIRRSTG